MTLHELKKIQYKLTKHTISQKAHTMPAPDTKERNFCFIYKGECLHADTIEHLHGNSAECVYCEEDGNWYARISLQRNFGRRLANIPNIIEEYNARISPACGVDMKSSVTCFKITSASITGNPILRKIQQNQKTNPTYWAWSLKKTKKQAVANASMKKSKSKTTQKKTKPSDSITTGLEGLARELTLDPSKLDMQGAYNAIARNYLLCHSKELSLTGKINSEDRTFLVSQLSRFFSKEMAYASKPFESHKGHMKLNGVHGTTAALALVNGGSAEDYDFLKDGSSGNANPATMDEDPDSQIVGEPNESICKCLGLLLGKWIRRHTTEDEMEVTTNDIVCMLNGGGMMSGAYRSTCVPGFIRPFILEKLAIVKDDRAKPSTYLFDVKGLAIKLGLDLN
jgi:hypothetical protein